MTPVINPAGSHFAELVAEKLNAQLQVYSRGGMSNGGICVQIKDAILAKPDLILLGTSGFDRVEFSIANKSNSQFHITDIVYAQRESVSTYFPWLNNQPSMIVDTLSSLLSQPDCPERYKNQYVHIPNIDEKISALKEYLIHLYDPMWKQQIDHWCMYATLHQLHESGIPYLIVRDLLGVSYFPWLNQRNYIAPKVDRIYNECRNLSAYFWENEDPGYHTPPDTQIKICQEILNHLREWKFINE